MLEDNDASYEVTNLSPVVSWGVLKAVRVARVTVPATKIDGRRIQGWREITREIERVRPNPRLLPPDPEPRVAVEEIELGTFLEESKIGVGDANVRTAVAMLPELRRIGAWIAEGVLGGEELNAADFRVALSPRPAMSLDDLRPMKPRQPGSNRSTASTHPYAASPIELAALS